MTATTITTTTTSSAPSTTARGVPAQRGSTGHRAPVDHGAVDLLRTLAGLPEDHRDRGRLREEAIEAWHPLAKHLAQRFHGRGEPLDDLTQIATVGLIKAGGFFGLLAAFMAWYNAAAGLLDSSNSFFLIPMGHFPWSAKGMERRQAREAV